MTTLFLTNILQINLFIYNYNKLICTGIDSDADPTGCTDTNIAEADYGVIIDDVDSGQPADTDNDDLIEYADDLMNYIKKKYEGKKLALDTNIKDALYEVTLPLIEELLIYIC